MLRGGWKRLLHLRRHRRLLLERLLHLGDLLGEEAIALLEQPRFFLVGRLRPPPCLDCRRQRRLLLLARAGRREARAAEEALWIDVDLLENVSLEAELVDALLEFGAQRAKVARRIGSQEALRLLKRRCKLSKQGLRQRLRVQQEDLERLNELREF